MEGRRGRWRGPLHGLPIAPEDNIDTAGVRAAAASALFADRVPAQDAPVVRRLRYQPALRRRREIERLRLDRDALFAGVDLLVTPTVRIPPRTIEECLARAVSERPLPPEPGNAEAFTALGLPALSVPCGFTASGLPTGLQIVGPRLGEGRVPAMARACERVAGWSARRPPLAG